MIKAAPSETLRLPTLVIVVSLAAYAMPSAAAGVLQRFGEDNKACVAWTDGCAICKTVEGKSPVCSLPGIACQPKPVTCAVSPKASPPR